MALTSLLPEFAVGRPQSRRGAFRSAPQLKAAIQAFIDAHQADPRPLV